MSDDGLQIIDVEQGSPEWHQARAGLATGTGARLVLAKGRKKGEEAVTRRDYRIQLVCERLTGRSLDDGGYESPWMRRGKELEADAIAAYEGVTGSIVTPIGFVRWASSWIGCSPDGIVGDVTRGLTEIKCPKPATHIRYLRQGQLPSDYAPQVTHNLLVTGAQWCDFVSFCEELPAPLNLFVVRVERADMPIADYGDQLDRFLAEVEDELAAVKALEWKLYHTSSFPEVTP